MPQLRNVVHRIQASSSATMIVQFKEIIIIKCEFRNVFEGKSLISQYR